MDKNNILSWGVFVHTTEMVSLAYAGAGVARHPLGRVGDGSGTSHTYRALRAWQPVTITPAETHPAPATVADQGFDRYRIPIRRLTFCSVTV